ncbi:MAG: DUF2934 domain-containing protein [Spartobacteria bacterium]
MPRKSKSNAADASTPSKNGKTTRLRSTTTPAKKPATKKAPAARKAKSVKQTGGSDPTDEQIAMRAYFISERRQRFALPGDASSDWLEAKRQLDAERT